MKPSKGPLDCYSGVALVATVPGAQGCVCDTGNFYVTDPSMGACSVANCGTYGIMPMPGATTVNTVPVSQLNAQLGMGPAVSEYYGPDSICATAVIPCNNQAGSPCPFNLPNAGFQLQTGINATTIEASDSAMSSGPAESSNVASFVTNGCDAALAQMAGFVSWSDFCNTNDCNKAYQPPHTPSSLAIGSMHSQSGGAVGGRKLLF